MTWQVTLSRQVGKQVPRLPLNVRQKLFYLLAEIEQSGPVRGNWPNYGKLAHDTHHCHIKKGNPCYVAVWEVHDKTIKLVEVTYVGTHEKAPYG
jgi:mRNA-degrading endonuclease RelE of RelBE toxin-antitoxin system